MGGVLVTAQAPLRRAMAMMMIKGKVNCEGVNGIFLIVGILVGNVEARRQLGMLKVLYMISRRQSITYCEF
jgi:hypothetical protein